MSAQIALSRTTISRFPTSANSASFCANKGWALLAEHFEPGASAMDDSRAELEKMIEHAADDNGYSIIQFSLIKSVAAKHAGEVPTALYESQESLIASGTSFAKRRASLLRARGK